MPERAPGADQADLFRHETGRLVARLTRRMGVHALDRVEDAVQDALVAAMRAWPLQGTPQNPQAWLYAAARNAYLDRARRSRFEAPLDDDVRDEAVSPISATEVADEELLELVLYCCHPALAHGTQLVLTLKLACGLGVDEIADAMLSRPEAVQQRIVRGKRELRAQRVLFELPAADTLRTERLPAVLHAVYLMFDAGYFSARAENWVRPILMLDALRLARMLAASPASAVPASEALAALLCFAMGRAPARIDEQGAHVTLERQDRRLWDPALIAEGFHWFKRAIRGEELTRYHIEAAIAAVHARAPSFAETDWPEIVRHYDQLLALQPSPVVELNRAIALRSAQGAAQALAALRVSTTENALEETVLWHATLGELHAELGNAELAARAFRNAARRSANAALVARFAARAESLLPRG